ncbi:MAG: nucleotide sugar dehydrogenase [Chloroflexi bacterium]|nr:MAG: nucleotide sugar dehydrogenase [Chloroflexota bacterium]
MRTGSHDVDVCVVGGCGRAGLPLAIAFAKGGLRTAAYDVDKQRVATVSAGRMPFMEQGGEEALRDALVGEALTATTDPDLVRRARSIVIVIGTPVDEFLNPDLATFRRAIRDLRAYISQGALVVLRSTVYPGTTEWLARELHEQRIQADVAMCPERIVEGHALDELASLPQIIGADTEVARSRARALFAAITSSFVDATTREAEVAKLLTNTWRYMKFAVANSFFMVTHNAGVDYTRVLKAIRHDYPRAADLPSPGFAAGPCLLKDTMQVAAFARNTFSLGLAAMAVNEGLPQYVVDQVQRRIPLAGKTVGILGMAFKPGSDDGRASLSYKLRKLLDAAGATVLCTDPYVADDGLVPLDRVLRDAEVLFVGVPHPVYRSLDLRGRELIDVWGALAPEIRV